MKKSEKFAGELEYARALAPEEIDKGGRADFEIELAERLFKAISAGKITPDAAAIEAECAGCDDLDGYDDKLNFYCGMAASYVFGKLYASAAEEYELIK